MNGHAFSSVDDAVAYALSILSSRKILEHPLSSSAICTGMALSLFDNDPLRKVSKFGDV